MPPVAAVLCVVDCSVGIAWLAGNGVPWGQELQHLVEEARRRGVLEQDGHLPERAIDHRDQLRWQGQRYRADPSDQHRRPIPHQPMTEQRLQLLRRHQQVLGL